ncbi:family 43 glycosylhydrolase, partial [uncultured Nonlabens sp.]
MLKSLTFLAFLLLTSSYAQENNPIFKGWYADPEGIIFDTTYWIYPTFSAPYDSQVHLDAFSSPNLTEWTKHERILDTTAIKWAKRAMWAPSIIKKENKYFLFFGANDIQSNNELGGIGVAVSDKPEGPFK